MSEEDAARDALWKLFVENHSYVRHHEVQRSTVASAVIAIVGALLAIAIFDKQLTPIDLPLLIIVMGLGVFGVLFSRKQQERIYLHHKRAEAALAVIDRLAPAAQLAELMALADGEHREAYPVLSRWRVGTFWQGLYGFLAIAGLLLAVLSIVSPVR